MSQAAREPGRPDAPNRGAPRVHEVEAAPADPHDASKPYGVLDIGSNSVRLVVYERLSRVPTAIFNERTLCGLGRGLAETGRLAEDAVDPALETLRRFATAAATLGVGVMDVVATAAVREAADGEAFLARVAAETGLTVHVLPGTEEARLSALGVTAAFPSAHGLAADLGGGSLELVRLDQGTPADHATLPLGALRADAPSTKKQAASATSLLRAVGWLEECADQPFYLVGGAWRALARLEMARRDHPIRIVQHFRLDRQEAPSVASMFAASDPMALREVMPTLARRRLETVPYSSTVLRAMIRVVRPSEVLFSAYGLREGLLHDRLATELRAADPLLAASAALSEKLGRSERYGEALSSWIEAAGLPRGGFAPRLVRAAALLSEIAWLDHPDFRAEHAFSQIALAPFVAIDHHERAFAALAVAYRYESRAPAGATATVERLLTPEQRLAARTIGLAMRLAERLSCGDPEILRTVALRVARERITLSVPTSLQPLIAGKVETALSALARLLERPADITTATVPVGTPTKT